MKSMRRALIANLFALAAAASLALPALADAPPRQIIVTGEGLVAATPDMAWVSVGVSHDALKAVEAMNMMSVAMAAVLAELEAAGIAPADLQTGQLSLEPRYDYSSYDGVPKMLGYTAATTIEVRVRVLDDLGSVLDAVVNEGANRLGGIRFDLDDKTQVMADARRAAVVDARGRAELYAQAAGVTLGALQTLTESGGYMAPAPMYELRMAADAGSAVPVAAGEVNFQAMVTLVYAIE